MIYIYKIINKINNKVYVGKTSNIDYRMYKHFNGHTGPYISSAIKKYGKNNFFYKILKECLTDEDANIYEKFFIKKNKSYIKKYGYNLTLGGEGVIPNKETREKISKALKGMFSGEKNPNYNKKHTKEAREKIRQSKLGKKMPESQRKILSEKLKGRIFTDQHRMKISKAKLGTKIKDVSNMKKPKTDLHIKNLKKSLRNKKNNRTLHWNGNIYCITELSEMYNISIQALSYRLKNGWSLQDALTKPINKKHRHKNYMEK